MENTMFVIWKREEKNMYEILKYVYVMLIMIFIFLVACNAEAGK